ncbi:hypothetical protein SUGI_0350990 [Cryptomeria japonica]|nr:hypothetical protein SUGI_0350990 [Cryptomeria japonica]
MQSDARWKQIQQESNHSSSVYYSLLLGAKHLDVLELIINITGQKAQWNLFPAQYIEVSTFLNIFIGISSPRPLFHPKAVSSALEDFAVAKYYRVLFAKPTPVSSKGEEDVSKMDLCKVGSIYPLIVAVLPDVLAKHRGILSEQGCIVREIEPIYPPENQVQFVTLLEFDEYSKMIYLDAHLVVGRLVEEFIWERKLEEPIDLAEALDVK